ncbi:hypothetical protein [Martelella alba]|uniref:Uncharacterized protein n=1 Tax=Martelella alba TaxID=2590451 RepID=A0ABY2SM05_9HYPH|nr:hypothetical protein [Martelella alba]TKI06673.1 hypothetical protein FCN80_08735 [Martelella alba]
MKSQPLKTTDALTKITRQASSAGAPPILTSLIIRISYVSGLSKEDVAGILLKPYAQGFITAGDAKRITQQFPFLEKVGRKLDLINYTITLIAAYMEIEVSYTKGIILPRNIIEHIMESYH